MYIKPGKDFLMTTMPWINLNTAKTEYVLIGLTYRINNLDAQPLIKIDKQ